MAKKPHSLNRRQFINSVSGFTIAAFLPQNKTEVQNNCQNPTLEKNRTRSDDAFQIRVKAATLEKELEDVKHYNNGDEDLYPNKIASYSKALPHNRVGEVDVKAYDVLIRAIKSGKHDDFESIPLGGYAKLANPFAGIAFDLIGPDCSQVTIPPAPCFNSGEQAAEAAELYWQAVLRDIPFSEYELNPLITKACSDLSKFNESRTAKENGSVSPNSIFRGNTPGELIGPYVSQFLWRDIPFSPIRAPQKIRTTTAGLDYLNNYDRWLAIQNGALSEVNRFDSSPRYIRNGRDLGEYVHRDFIYQAFFAACLMLHNMGTPPDGGNPYKYSRTQSGFVTFGPAYTLHLVSIVANIALKATWFQKWLVHRRLRPEEFGGRVHNLLINSSQYPIHNDLLNSEILEVCQAKFGSYLLPSAYPEGSPMHTSYPAGHAAIAGACVTMLKACFDESFVIPNPVTTSANGLNLVPYKGTPLTVGGELNKLATNIGMGRNFAGIHWRSDCVEGMNLGEKVAINVLKEMKLTGQEIFEGFSLTKFDGTRITL
jgi:hypothetical protein